jgi:hypothetical protein
MAGRQQLSDYTDTKVAAKFITSSGNVVGTKIDATGFRRAHLVFIIPLHQVPRVADLCLLRAQVSQARSQPRKARIRSLLLIQQLTPRSPG